MGLSERPGKHHLLFKISGTGTEIRAGDEKMSEK
jgi:hypothetical protein